METNRLRSSHRPTDRIAVSGNGTSGSTIDTTTSTETTHRRAFLRAEWRDLVMLNYEVPPEALEPLVPAGVDLDHWRGQLYVSVVGFLFANTRLLGLSVPGHRSFQEVNLRFYVRRVVNDQVRCGVVFVRELVPRRSIALTARFFYNEPYQAMPMRHRFERFGLLGSLRREYAWHAGSDWTRMSATTSGNARALEPGSEEEFITEHYWGYTRQRDGGTVEYRVEHPRWNVWTATEANIAGDLSAVYGETFARLLAGPPRSAFVADGSPVIVYWPKRIR